jgi:hypothetical protein
MSPFFGHWCTSDTGVHRTLVYNGGRRGMESIELENRWAEDVTLQNHLPPPLKLA